MPLTPERLQWHENEARLNARRKRTCYKCKGTGLFEDDDCLECGGGGFIIFDLSENVFELLAYIRELEGEMSNDQPELDIETDDFHCPKCQSPDVDYVGGDSVVSVGGSALSHVEFYKCANCGNGFSA